MAILRNFGSRWYLFCLTLSRDVYGNFNVITESADNIIRCSSILAYSDLWVYPTSALDHTSLCELFWTVPFPVNSPSLMLSADIHLSKASCLCIPNFTKGFWFNVSASTIFLLPLPHCFLHPVAREVRHYCICRMSVSALLDWIWEP